MQERVFIKDWHNEKWIETNNKLLCTAEPEELPLVVQLRQCLIFDAYGAVENLYDRDLIFWHHRQIKIGNVKKCRRENDSEPEVFLQMPDENVYPAIHVCFKKEGLDYEPSEGIKISRPVRCRVMANEKNAKLTLLIEYACLRYCHAFARDGSIRFRLQEFNSSTLYFDLEQGRWLFFDNVEKKNSNGWQDDHKIIGDKEKQKLFESFIPSDDVLDCALSVMQDYVAKETGIRPTVLSRTTGVKKLAAFAERPFDLHIVYLNKLLSHVPDYEERFGKDNRDCFKNLCELLEITPPKSLRKAYTFMPYAPVAYLVMKKLGFTDVNVIQRFFCLERIGLIDLAKLEWNPEENDFCEHDRILIDNWQGICRYGRAIRGENIFSHLLLQISLNEDVDLMTDIFMMAARYFADFDNETKECIVRENWGSDLHDLLVDKLADIEDSGVENKRVAYEPEELEYECNINGYDIRLVHYTRELQRLGRNMHNCVGGYTSSVVSKRCIIAKMTKGNEYCACIEIRDKMINQALGKFNNYLTGEVLLVILYWAKINGFEFAQNYLQQAKITQREKLKQEKFTVTTITANNTGV